MRILFLLPLPVLALAAGCANAPPRDAPRPSGAEMESFLARLDSENSAGSGAVAGPPRKAAKLADRALGPAARLDVDRVDPRLADGLVAR